MTKRLFIDEIGWNGKNFMDLQEEPISRIFKLYPWEWMIHEEFGPHLLKEPWQVIEPAWKMVLSNKGILPLLWEMFPRASEPAAGIRFAGAAWGHLCEETAPRA